MALFNKLFSSRKSCGKNQEVTCDKTFTFTKDQVRIVLYRECEFRGRKLLFDSKSVEKVPLSASCNTPNHPEKYVEVSNGYKYQYTKPCADVNQLGEMVFGSVAMSYRGTSLKIHSLTSPPRLMCSQIFPSPRHPRGCSSTSQSYTRSSIASFQSLEQSVRLDDSGASSANSISDRLSVHSTGSDTLLVCRGSRSVPLDVPTVGNSSLSVIGDSGFSGEQSYNSVSSGPQSLPLSYVLSEGGTTFSCGSLYKRWLRSTSTSLEHSASSLTGSHSADECLLKPHPRSSKLGLAVLIEFPSGQEQLMEQFLMEHAALIESMIWRTRQAVEVAYIRHNSFVSLMYEAVVNAIQWLVDLLSGPQLANHLWISLAPVCDKFSSISDEHPRNSEKCGFSSNSSSRSDAFRTVSLSSLQEKCEKSFTSSASSASFNNSQRSNCSLFDSSDTLDKSSDFTFLHWTKLLTTEWAAVSSKSSYSCSDKNIMAEKCITELCELLETIDVKHTNFTLVTAVLTHHLGWVTTVLPPSATDKDKVSELHNPCNPLWGQLIDLYGAIGHPTKVAHTIITGTNKADLISKILNSLTYFIRCSDTERKCVTRLDIKKENESVDCICQQKSCIPKENYKKYADHLKDMEASNSEFLRRLSEREESGEKKKKLEENIEMSSFRREVEEKSRPLALSKTQTCLKSLNEVSEESPPKKLYPSLEQLCKEENVSLNSDEPLHELNEKNRASHKIVDKLKSLGIQAVSYPEKNSKFELSNANIYQKVNTLCRVPASAVLYHKEREEQQLVDINEACEHFKKVFAPKKVNVGLQMRSNPEVEVISEVQKKVDSKEDQKNVIFVLGDDEKLIGLRKTHNNSDPYFYKSLGNSQDSNCVQKNEASKLSHSFCEKHKLAGPSSLNINKINKSKSFFNFSDSPEQEDDITSPYYKDDVINPCCKEDDFFKNSKFKDSDFTEQESDNIKPSTSWTSLDVYKKTATNHSRMITLESEEAKQEEKSFVRSQSVPPEGKKPEANSKQEANPRYRYSVRQFPQIVTNFMRSKNLELAQLPFADKKLQLGTFSDYPTFDFSNCDTQMEEVEALQTPSNASELEFTSDLVAEPYEPQHAKQTTERKSKTFLRTHVPNTVVKEPCLKKTSVVEHPLSNNAMFEHEEDIREEERCDELKSLSNKMQIIELPRPKSEPVPLEITPINYTSSLMRGICDRYIPDMVLQGTLAPKSEWESALRRDLCLATRHPLLDHPIDEAIAIVANTDTWEIQLMSSHTYVVDKGCSGVRVGMSQLVSNMLESLLHMWKLRTPPEYCILHIEQRLQELCILSKALAELLLATEFCSMDLLTSVLQLEVNDVPLLMAVASTHSPQVTQKYGLSFQ